MKTRFEVVSLEEVPMSGNATEPIILVVDDDRIVADTLSLILKRAGYSIMTAYEPMRALEIVKASRPALLLSDVAMPEMDGVALAIAVIAMHPECDVLLISGHATSRDLVAAREAGHNFKLLEKPVHPTEILRQVAEKLKKLGKGIKTMPQISRSFTSLTTEVA